MIRLERLSWRTLAKPKGTQPLFGRVQTMSDTAEKLKAALAQLPASERAALAHYLIHSLDDHADPDAEAAWDAELARRMAEIRSGFRFRVGLDVKRMDQ